MKVVVTFVVYDSALVLIGQSHNVWRVNPDKYQVASGWCVSMSVAVRSNICAPEHNANGIICQYLRSFLLYLSNPL